MANAAQQAYAPLAVAAPGGVIDLSKGTYFQTTISAATTLSIINRPADCMVFELEVLLTAGAITWPANVTAPNAAFPSLAVGQRHRFTLMRVQTEAVDKWDLGYAVGYAR